MAIPKFREVQIPQFKEFDPEEPDTYEPIKQSWRWLTKYFDQEEYSYGAPWNECWKGEFPPRQSTGIYGSTGSGKTMLHLSAIELCKLAGYNNIIIDDKKLETLGFLLPGQPKLMQTTARYFPDFTDGTYPARPHAMPSEDVTVYFPVTDEVYSDEVLKELQEWPVEVKFIKFNPCVLFRNPWIISALTHSTTLEKNAFDIAVREYKEELQEQGINVDTYDDFDYDRLAEIAKEKPWVKRSNPAGKLQILKQSGLFTKNPQFRIYDDGETVQGEAEIMSAMDFKKVLKPPSKPSNAHVHIFSSAYLASPSISESQPFVAALTIFFLTREGCWKHRYNTRGSWTAPTYTHIPEAGMLLNPRTTVKAIQEIANTFVGTFTQAMMLDRIKGLYHWINTQVARDVHSSITANQSNIFFMPGLSSGSELNWIERGAGVAFDKNLIKWIISQIGDKQSNRGKALKISTESSTGPQRVWIRPRCTYHFEEEESQVQALKYYRKNYGTDFAQKWVRWDSS